MHDAMPPLSALRAFEAAARHLSLTVAARELNVTPGALSHQIRGLEEFLGVTLFERRSRAIALTPAGRVLHPGLQSGFTQLRDAVGALRSTQRGRVLVVSTSPGFTSKWLAPRLYRFAGDNPDIDVRISASVAKVNFVNDGVDIAVRNMMEGPIQDPALESELLLVITFIPVCSPRLLEKYGPIETPADLARLPLIHDETLAGRAAVPNWSDWFVACGIDSVNLQRGLRFNSAEHALDAVGEGAGVLLSHDILAYDDLRTGRLTMPLRVALRTRRAFQLVWPRGRKPSPIVEEFRRWIKSEIATIDRKILKAKLIGPR